MNRDDRKRLWRCVVSWVALCVVGLASCTSPTTPHGVVRATPHLVSGSVFSCLLNAAGDAICWGRWGSVAGDPTASTLPTIVKPLDEAVHFTLLSAGTHTCGLTAIGEAYCWGQNSYGQLGDGTTAQRPRPIRVQTPARFTSIAAGTYTTCALSREGQTYCWGRGDNGALGTGNLNVANGVLTPTAVPTITPFTNLSGGLAFCGLTTTGKVHCWGQSGGSFDPGSGEPGACSNSYYIAFAQGGCFVPTPVPGAVTLRTISANGGPTLCGTSSDGAAYCWGEGWLGTLGDGKQGPGVHAVVPVPVSGGLRFQQLTIGATHVCGLTIDNRAVCWGNTFLGYLGNGFSGVQSPPSAVPVNVSGGLRFANVAAGSYHTCGLTEAGEVWCWGAGAEGQLGRSPQDGNSSVPIRAQMPQP